jgi:protein CpxP
MRPVIKNLLACAAVTAAIGLTPAVSPAFVCGDGAAPAAHHLKKMTRQLGLSPQQQQQIKDIFTRNRSQAEPLVKQLRAEHRALRSLIHGDTFDEAAIRAQSAKIAAVQADLTVQRARTAQEVRKLLTPEQVKKFKELREHQKGPGYKHGRKAGCEPCAEPARGQEK